MSEMNRHASWGRGIRIPSRACLPRPRVQVSTNKLGRLVLERQEC
jgi:hypothetical protein